ncbi:MAG: peptidase dimerization domain-containing protein, partial [Sphingomonadales bacterium]|nr:peptidase dimerization domain-containing protein [Sphingomonadales bacterium]
MREHCAFGVWRVQFLGGSPSIRSGFLRSSSRATLALFSAAAIGCLAALCLRAVDKGFVVFIANSDPAGARVAPYGGCEALFTPEGTTRYYAPKKYPAVSDYRVVATLAAAARKAGNTVHTGIIRGGTALNVIPHECAFDFEFRHLPGDDPDRLLNELQDYIESRLQPEMRATHPAAGFTIEP